MFSTSEVLLAFAPVLILAVCALDPSQFLRGMRFHGAAICGIWTFSQVAMSNSFWLAICLSPLSAYFGFRLGDYIDKNRRDLRNGQHTCSICRQPLRERSFVPYIEFVHGICPSCKERLKRDNTEQNKGRSQ